jgi:predicted peroxiredoxin
MASNRKRIAAAIAAIIVVGLAFALAWQNNATAQQLRPKTVVFSFNSSPDNIFQVQSGFHVAEDALSAGRHVILFFNGRGVTIPTKKLANDRPPNDLRLGDERALWLILRDLINDGAEVIVARDAADMLNLTDSEFIPEARLGVNIFHKMPDDTVVFTY